MSGLENPFGVTLFVCVALTVAAVIDGWMLKVPNWLTFPFALSGLVFHLVAHGWSGLGWSFLGLVCGLALLLIPYAIGGMGAGDVKLFAGVGAWLGPVITFGAFCVSAVIGGLLAVLMVLFHAARGRDWKAVRKSVDRFQLVGFEIMTIKNPTELAELAAARKPTAMLLPYGIPLAIGTIGYMWWIGLI